MKEEVIPRNNFPSGLNFSALSDDDEEDHNMAYGKQLDPSVQSHYYPGNSVTYCSKNIKYNNTSLNDNSIDYREGRQHYKEKGTPRVFNEANYQVFLFFCF